MDRMILASVAAIAVSTALSLTLLAADGEMAQRDISFVPGRVTINAGEQVVFVNDDVFGHNVYSASPGGEFDIGLQRPGARNPVPFRRAGTYVIQCRIHPRMRATVVVTN